jgi:hypothetical protein
VNVGGWGDFTGAVLCLNCMFDTFEVFRFEECIALFRKTL